MNRLLLTTLAALALGACGHSVVVAPGPSDPQPDVSESAGSPGPSTAATLGIPPGHLPPPGMCRIWIPGTPPGHQGPSGRCSTLASRVPANGWLVYRPSKSRKEVHVSVYDDHRPSLVVVVRVFDVKSGVLLREERGHKRQ